MAASAMRADSTLCPTLTLGMKVQSSVEKVQRFCISFSSRFLHQKEESQNLFCKSNLLNPQLELGFKEQIVLLCVILLYIYTTNKYTITNELSWATISGWRTPLLGMVSQLKTPVGGTQSAQIDLGSVHATTTDLRNLESMFAKRKHSTAFYLNTRFLGLFWNSYRCKRIFRNFYFPRGHQIIII